MASKKNDEVVEVWTRLRRRAEAELPPVKASAEVPLSAEAATRLIHELQVHQVELVMQNAELREAQAQAEVSRAQYVELFELAPVGYLVVDEQGVVVAANRLALDLLGASRSEVVGHRLTSHVSPQDQDLLYLGRKALLETSSPRAWELRLKRRDGSEVWVRMDARLVIAPDGSRTMRAALADLTAARSKELLVHRLAAAVEQAPTAVLITSAGGDIEYVNPAFEQSSGYSRAEVLGRNPRFLKSGAHEQVVYQDLWGTITAGKPWRGRLVNRAKAGQLFTGDLAVAPVSDATGAVVSFVAVMRDVTAELQLQQQLVESQKLESLGRLAAGVAHDFNNLLSVVLLSVGELLEDPPPGPAGVRQLSGEIRDAGVRAADLTRQLLAFARKQVFSPVPVDLHEAVRRCEKLLHRLLGEDVEIEVHASSGLWPVLCDPTQLEQIILNVAINARDAMPREGRLTLRTSALPLGDPGAARYAGLAPGDYAQVTIADTGVGMPPDVLARIFDPFFTTKRAGKGTGLGLATVQGIATRSGGAVRCESAPGEGTTFFLCLPRATSQAVSATPAPVSGPSRNGSERLLLVEDDEHVRRAAVRALEAAGYRLHVAASPSDALALTASELAATELVITDVIMPGMDGGALAAALRRRVPALRVLFISGYTDDALGAHGVLPGSVELLSKPFTGPELLARVRALLDAPQPGPA